MSEFLPTEKRGRRTQNVPKSRTVEGGFVDRVALLDQLERAQKRESDCEQHIARHRKVIAALRAEGQATSEAEEFLRALKISQALHIAHRKSLETLLANGNPE